MKIVSFWETLYSISMEFRYPIRTRYSETAQDGVIHHPSYVVYFEVARLEFLKKLDFFDINELQKKKILCPVIDLSVRYLKPLFSLEDIVVRVFVESVTKVRFTLGYQILRNEICVTTASVSHCFIDESMKPIPIMKDVYEKLIENLTSSHKTAVLR